MAEKKNRNISGLSQVAEVNRVSSGSKYTEPLPFSSSNSVVSNYLSPLHTKNIDEHFNRAKNRTICV